MFLYVQALREDLIGYYWLYFAVTVVSLLGVSSWYSLLTPLATALPALFAKLSTVYNPFIYAISHHKYRQVSPLHQCNMALDIHIYYLVNIDSCRIFASLHRCCGLTFLPWSLGRSLVVVCLGCAASYRHKPTNPLLPCTPPQGLIHRPSFTSSPGPPPWSPPGEHILVLVS